MIDLKDLIKKSINIPVIELHDPVTRLCATYYLQSDNSDLEGNGEEQEGIETYCIDVWSRDRTEVSMKCNQLKKSITKLKYNTIPYIEYTYDENGKFWRGMLTFSHVKEEYNE